MLKDEVRTKSYKAAISNSRYIFKVCAVCKRVLSRRSERNARGRNHRTVCVRAAHAACTLCERCSYMGCMNFGGALRVRSRRGGRASVSQRLPWFAVFALDRYPSLLFS
jgi:hypothetical protein